MQAVRSASGVFRMAQVSKSEFKRCRVVDGEVGGRAGSEDPAVKVTASVKPGYGSRMGGMRGRVRESFHIAMPSTPVLAAIIVLMVVCIVLGVIAVRGLTSTGFSISRAMDSVAANEGGASSGGQVALEGVQASETPPVAVSSPEPGASADSTVQADTSYICVYVTGQVVHPGVVSLPAGSRIYEALDAAGGASEQADLSAVNLAKALNDEEMVYVPAVGEQAASFQSAGGAASLQSAPALINVNTAGVEELKTLNGIGDVLAQAIVDERERNGAFANVEDLARVSGIGEKTLAKFADKVCV